MNLLNIFENIVLSSLIGSVIVLMILIIKTILKHKLNSTFHYYIWLILLIKLIIPFGPQASFNISNLFEKSYVKTTTNENTQKLQINSSKQLENTDLADSTAISTLQPSNKSVISNTMNIPLKIKINIKRILCITWIFGVVLSIVILFAGHKKLRKIVKDSINNVNNTHKEILYDCMKTMNIRTEVDLSYSTKISSPSLCGFIKPKILIPMSVAMNICAEEFKCIVMHELTHFKNKDIFINWVITLLSMTYWFNPILLYGFHKMRQDCEFSCDSQVISYLGEGGHLQYGSALIRVLELACSNKRLIGTTPMVMNSLEMKRRLIMISKYKKINIKSILLGTVVVVIIGSLGITLNTSSVRSHKNIAKATTLHVETLVTTSKSRVNNISNGSASPIKLLHLTDSTKSTATVSPDIVIYNSHPDEVYPSGMKISDVGAILNDKLVKEGFNSCFISCALNTDYNKSFQITRDLITKNVKSYSNTILLDIHRDKTEKNKSDAPKMLFILAKSNPHYKANKKFVDSLIENIKNSNQIKSEIYFYQYGISYYNQDLSNNSTLIELGNNMSSDSDIEACVNALVSALKNTQKVSSN
jgi:bla regulator protein BlaR1